MVSVIRGSGFETLAGATGFEGLLRDRQTSDQLKNAPNHRSQLLLCAPFSASRFPKTSRECRDRAEVCWENPSGLKIGCADKERTLGPGEVETTTRFPLLDTKSCGCLNSETDALHEQSRWYRSRTAAVLRGHEFAAAEYWGRSTVDTAILSAAANAVDV